MSVEVGKGQRDRSGRTAVKVAAGVIAAVVVGMIVAALYLARSVDGHIPPAVTIAGIDVGGNSIDEARGKLEVLAAARLDQPITLVHTRGQLRTTVAELGVEAQLERVLAQAQQSRDGWSRLRARLGFAPTIDIPLGFTARPKQVRTAVSDIAAELGREVVPPTVEIDEEEIVPVKGSSGSEIDQDMLFERLAGLPAVVEIPLREVEPSITYAEAVRAASYARRILEEMPAVVSGDERVKFSKKLLRKALRFRERDGRLIVSLDRAPLRSRLERTFTQLKREPADAEFRVADDIVRIVQSRPGREFDSGATLDALLPNLGEPQVPAEFHEIEPEFSTRDAKNMKIRKEISAFTTRYACCQARVQNIQLAASILDGTIVEAGATFSLNEVLGKRTKERGFVKAPQILNDRLVPAVGGGVSQVATTIFNAAFFAGLELVEHRPHSFYISRYPMGREATVSWGGPELVFRNNWPAAILIKASADDTSVTFRFYSAKLNRRVTTATGAPRNVEEAKVKRERNPELRPGKRKVIQDGGIDGFTVDYARAVYRGGELLKEERWTVKYEPHHKIVELGPRPPKEDEPDEDPTDEPGEPPEVEEEPAPIDGEVDGEQESGEDPESENGGNELSPTEESPSEESPAVEEQPDEGQ